jgi:hypothetical protein
MGIQTIGGFGSAKSYTWTGAANTSLTLPVGAYEVSSNGVGVKVNNKSVTNGSVVVSSGAVTVTSNSELLSYPQPIGIEPIDGPGHTITQLISDRNTVYAFTTGQTSSSTDGDNWVTITNAFTAMYAAAYGAGKFVVAGIVGGVSGLYTSTDAVTWSLTADLTGYTSFSGGQIVFGGTRWIAYKYATTTPVYLTSTDGVTWTTLASGATTNVASGGTLYYLNGTWITQGSTASYNTSTDGVNWTARSSAQGSSSYLLGEAGGKFVSVLSSTTSTTYYSTDAVTWTSVNNAFTSTTISSLIKVGNTLIAQASNNYGFATTDGVSWNDGVTMSAGDGTITSQVAEAAGVYYLKRLNIGASHLARTMSSPTGFNVKYSSKILGLAYGNGVYAAVSDNGDLSTSSDGITWTHRATPWTSTSTTGDIAFGNGKFILFTRSSMYYSTDAVTWSFVTVSATDTSGHRVYYLNGKYILISSVGDLYTSINGLNWASKGAPTGFSSTVIAKDMAYGNGTYVVVGTSAQMATSKDLVVWNSGRQITTNVAINSVAFGNGTFVAVGDGGVVLTSADGTVWNVASGRATTTTNNPNIFGSSTLTKVRFINGKFFVASSGGSLATSADGITWTTLATTVSGHTAQTYPSAMVEGPDKVVIGGYLSQGTYYMKDTTPTKAIVFKPISSI